MAATSSGRTDARTLSTAAPTLRGMRFPSRLSLALPLLAVLVVPHAALAKERLGSIAPAVERLNGSPKASPRDVEVSTTSARQSTAYTGGETLLIINMGSTEVFCRAGNSTVTVTADDGVPLAEKEKWYVILTPAQTHVACITAADTSTVRIWELE